MTIVPAKVTNFNDDYDQLFQYVVDRLPSSVETLQFPYTTKAALSLVAGADALKNGILDVAESENGYATSVLWRSLIEHYVKFLYIFLEWMKSQSDEPAKEYALYSQIQELLEMARAYKIKAQLNSEEVPERDPLEIIREHELVDSNLTKGELNRLISKWKYRQILTDMATLMQGQSTVRIPVPGKLVMAYAELSSYVHGGPDATRTSGYIVTEQEGDERVVYHCEWASIQVAEMKNYLTMMLGQKDKELLKQFTLLSGCLQEFLSDGV